MARGNRNPSIGEETGWISMVDLLLMFLIVAIFGGLALTSGHRDSTFQLRTATDAATQTIGDLTAELNRIQERLGEYPPLVESLESKVRRLEFELRQILSDAGEEGDPTEFLERMSRLRSELDQTRNLLDESRDGVVALESRAEAAEAARAEAAESRDRALEESAEAQRERDAARRLQADAENRASDAEKEAAAVLKALEDERLRNAAMKAELADARKEIAESEVDLGVAVGAVDQASSEIRDLQERIEGLDEKDRAIRQSLLGISGKIDNVVFVVDRSDSMNDGGRWDDAKRTVALWIEHLPVESAALVVFSAEADVYPTPDPDSESDRRTLSVMSDEVRAEMLRELDAVTPLGLTLTAKAMRVASSFEDADAIILFTDGAPERLPNAIRDPAQEVFEVIDAWRALDRERRVHSVGIGNYFNRKMSEFLLGVAARGNGVFIGR